MSLELKIQDMGPKKTVNPLKYSFLPNLPMRMLVVAPSNGGKSNMLQSLSPRTFTRLVQENFEDSSRKEESSTRNSLYSDIT